jgi:hypothetical protein
VQQRVTARIPGRPGRRGQDGITYGDLVRTLERAREIYATREGVAFLLRRRAAAIAALLQLGKDGIRGVLSVGYPNYVLPEIEPHDPRRQHLIDDSLSVVVTEEYVNVRLERARARDRAEAWPCAQCRQARAQTPLRSREDVCASPITPFAFFTALPDLDLYIVVQRWDDAETIIRHYETVGLIVPERQMPRSILDFPSTLNIDPQFVRVGDLRPVLHGIEMGIGDWRRVPLPLLVDHGHPQLGRINHFGLDLVFSMIDEAVPDRELRAALVAARRSLIRRRGVEAIIDDIKETRSASDLPRRIGGLVADHRGLEAQLRARLTRWERSSAPEE